MANKIVKHFAFIKEHINIATLYQTAIRYPLLFTLN